MLSLIIIGIGVVVLTAMATWTFTYSYMRKKAQSTGCPFGQACLHYNEQESKAAMTRVVKLLLENMKEEEAYKRLLRDFMKKSEKIKT